jgi:hypothetical protein
VGVEAAGVVDGGTTVLSVEDVTPDDLDGDTVVTVVLLEYVKMLLLA